MFEFDYENDEEIIFASRSTSEFDAVNSVALSGELIDLNKIANAFTHFLRSSGYDYVTGITIHKGKGDVKSTN